MPRAIRDFSPIYPTEQVVLSFDFSAAIAAGETLVTSTGSPSVSVAVVLGIDGSPASRLIGTPSIVGPFVVQMIGGLQSGATYDIIATAAKSTGEILTTSAHQSCQSIA